MSADCAAERKAVKMTAKVTAGTIRIAPSPPLEQDERRLRAAHEVKNRPPTSGAEQVCGRDWRELKLRKPAEFLHSECFERFGFEHFSSDAKSDEAISSSRGEKCPHRAAIFGQQPDGRFISEP